MKKTNIISVPNWTSLIKEKTEPWEAEMFDNAIKEYFYANPELKKKITLGEVIGFCQGFEVGFKFAEILRKWQSMR